MWIDLKDKWPNKFGKYKVKVMNLEGNESEKLGVWHGVDIGFILPEYDLEETEFIEYWEPTENN